MGDREILETSSNPASKNTSETDIFPHGPKSLLTSVMPVTILNWNTFHISTFCLAMVRVCLANTFMLQRCFGLSLSV